MRDKRILILPLLVTLIVFSMLFQTQAAETVTGPQIVISSFDINPSHIEGGEDFTATVTLKNIGDQPAANIKLSIDEGVGTSSPFAPYLQGSSIALESKMAAGEEIQKTFQVGSSSTAVPGINNLYLTIRYKDDQGKEFSNTEVIGVPIGKSTQKEISRPKITISQVKIDPKSAEVGREFSLSLKVNNFGNQRARAIKVVAKQLEGSSGLDIFFPVDSSNAFTIDYLNEGSSEQKTLKFMVSPKAEAKIYNLVIEMEYRDQDGQAYTTSEVISIPIYKEGKTFLVETGPKLIIQSQRVNPTPVLAGENFDIFLDVWNASETTAKNIRLSLVENDTNDLNSFSPVNTSNVIYIPELLKGQKVTRNITLAVNKDADSKRYNLIVKMSYEDVAGKQYESSGIVSVLVKGNNAKYGPELTITSYKLSEELVEAGSNFQLTLNIRNIGDVQAKNVKLSLVNVEGGQTLDVFSPLNSSNALYFETIDPGATEAKSIEMFINGEAKSKIYNIVINFSYQGDDGTKLTDSDGTKLTGSNGTKNTGSEVIGIPVIEDQNLNIVSLKYPEKLKQGEECNISAEFINIGKYPLENLFITFNGNFELEHPTYYLNKFDSGSTDVFETRALINEPGKYEGQMIFSYTNSYKQERVITKQLNFNVVEDAAKEVMTEPKKKEGFWSKFKRFILALLGLA